MLIFFMFSCHCILPTLERFQHNRLHESKLYPQLSIVKSLYVLPSLFCVMAAFS